MISRSLVWERGYNDIRLGRAAIELAESVDEAEWRKRQLAEEKRHREILASMREKHAPVSRPNAPGEPKSGAREGT